jgi:glycosyltransferase involved in cell wall biosynthesis
MSFFSIAIPAYEMHGKGAEFLNFSFNCLNSQTYKDFEVVVSDHSKTNEIEKICEEWSSYLNIVYLKNEINRGSSSANINNALYNCSSEWIKILFQDDFLYRKDSLEIIKKHILENSKLYWIANACCHTNDGVNLHTPHTPKWNYDQVIGNNGISSPSVICINKNIDIKFDEKLLWLMDVDFYQKMYMKYGEPYYINEILVVNRNWGNRLSDTLSENLKNEEVLMMYNRYFQK